MPIPREMTTSTIAGFKPRGFNSDTLWRKLASGEEQQIKLVWNSERKLYEFGAYITAQIVARSGNSGGASERYTYEITHPVNQTVFKK